MYQTRRAFLDFTLLEVFTAMYKSPFHIRCRNWRQYMYIDKYAKIKLNKFSCEIHSYFRTELLK
jgi:hypothetical protein